MSCHGTVEARHLAGKHTNYPCSHCPLCDERAAIRAHRAAVEATIATLIAANEARRAVPPVTDRERGGQG